MALIASLCKQLCLTVLPTRFGVRLTRSPRHWIMREWQTFVFSLPTCRRYKYWYKIYSSTCCKSIAAGVLQRRRVCRFHLIESTENLFFVLWVWGQTLTRLKMKQWRWSARLLCSTCKINKLLHCSADWPAQMPIQGEKQITRSKGQTRSLFLSTFVFGPSHK